MPTANASPALGAIRAARLAAGLTQVDLARQAACSRQYLRLLEAGYSPDPKRSPALRHIVAVLTLLGHPPALTPETSPTRPPIEGGG